MFVLMLPNHNLHIYKTVDTVINFVKLVGTDYVTILFAFL